MGLLGFLLGVTVLVWTSTGLAGLLAHGSWPRGVSFTRTPQALRHLIGDPRDLAGAWPETPADQLPGYGAFWGLLIGEVMVAVVLAVFVVGTYARWRAVRAAARARGGRPGLRQAPKAGAVAPGPAQAPSPAGDPTEGPVRTPLPQPRTTPPPAAHPPAAHPPAAHPPAAHQLAAHPPTAHAHPHAAHTPVPDPSALAAPTTRTGTPHSAPTVHAATPHPALLPQPATPHPALTHHNPTAPPLPAVPEPRQTGPRLLYGDRAARRPHALQAVLEAAGPALVVTSDPTLWADTKDARAKLGPVVLYDPGHLCDSPARLHWSPAEGCEDTATAASRAAALLAPVRPRARVDAAVADTAETLLRCWLHAAAVDGRPFKQVHRWAQHHGTAHEPVRILRTHPKAAGGHAGLLESALTAYPERRDAARALTARALTALSLVHIREACTPHRNDTLALASFAAEGGTLYVVGEPIEDPRTNPGAMPLLTALTSHVVEHGRRMAARSSDGRLDPPIAPPIDPPIDPPMTLVLDDVAAVAPLPRLPELLASGHGDGLPTLVLLRSREQARARWQTPLEPRTP
ncbi:type VI secretion protein [Streptomyces fradiae]|uniref:type VI secretion protein n=1 Tax=Streptomyces fradiae TaxID=1906 RepID=UPI0035BE1C2D